MTIGSECEIDENENPVSVSISISILIQFDAWQPIDLASSKEKSKE